MTPTLHIHPIVSLPFEENTYIVWREGSRDALVVDHDDLGPSLGEMLEGWNGGEDARVVGDLAVRERHVQVLADEDTF